MFPNTWISPFLESQFIPASSWGSDARGGFYGLEKAPSAFYHTFNFRETPVSAIELITFIILLLTITLQVMMAVLNPILNT